VTGDRDAGVLYHDKALHRGHVEPQQRAGREQGRIGSDRTPCRQGNTEGAYGIRSDPWREESIAWVFGKEREQLLLGVSRDGAADAGEGRLLARQLAARDQHRTERTVWLSVRAGVPERHDATVLVVHPCRALHVRQEEREGIVRPCQLEPAAIQRPVVDLPTRARPLGGIGR